MPTNFYFNNFPAEQITQEQLLVEDLVIEAMQMYGMDVFYLPRTVRSGNEIDYLYGEDTTKEYLTAYPIEMYLENFCCIAMINLNNRNFGKHLNRFSDSYS